MDDRKISTAKACLSGAESNSMTFPQIVGALLNEGFESYAIDFRRSMATYYLPDGSYLDLPTHHLDTPVAAAFDDLAIGAAIREAQQMVPGYTYKGFCAKVAKAGCAGYQVSFLGRRAVYFGRTGETHLEHFPA